MQNSKLLKILQTLSDKEKKLFLKFVHSPFFNENEQICKFANYLLASAKHQKIKPYEEGETNYWEKSRVFAALYPDRKFDAKGDTDIRLLMSYLFRLLKKFLMYQSSFNNLIENKLAFAEELFKRNLGDFALTEMTEIENNLEQQKVRNHAFFQHKFLTQERKGWGKTLMGIRSAKNSSDYGAVLENLDIYYVLKKMDYYCIILNEKQIFVNNSATEMMQAILDFVKNTPHIFAIPAVQMYYYAIQLLQSKGNSEYATRFFDLLLTEKEKCSELDLRNLHTYARNYCIRRKNAGDHSVNNQLFNLYEAQLKLGILHGANGEIPVSTVKNIVTLGLQMQKSDWLETVFLPEQTPYILEEFRENTLNYCYAQISFEKKDYNKCLFFVKQNEKLDSFFDAGSRRLAVKSFYELQEYESALNDLHTFRKFLYTCNKKKLLPETTIRSNRSFCNFLERLVLVPDFQKMRLQKLKEEIAQAPLCLDKEWLLEKIGAK